ncbi:MAG: ABC-ATPase domain-containing protein [Myxococcota bacterium]
MKTLADLRRALEQLDGASYGAYKRLRGAWRGDDVDVIIDRVQGDPFATPSVVCVRVAAPEYGGHETAPGPARVALCDLLTRRFAAHVRGSARSGSGRSGDVSIDVGGPAMLARSACDFVDGALELRLRVGLPARGRRILGRAAASLLVDHLPRAAAAMRASDIERSDRDAWREAALEHAALREQLRERGLVAFVADGSILPRRSGASLDPLPGAVPFEAPASLAVELDGLHGPIRGLGIRCGITVITGAGFHGKSTLLQALAAGVYPHIPGDGRTLVVTEAGAMKVRSEDGRSVRNVDLRPFIQDLPGDRSIASFETDDASGSTSLAASIVESIGAGATTLLLDEDTCATNLLVRDARMQALLQRDTIVPLVDRVQTMHRERGISTVIVVGGSGDYLDVADTVISMDDYRARDTTDDARALCVRMPTTRTTPPAPTSWGDSSQVIQARSVGPRRDGKGRAKVRAMGLRDLRYGDETLQLDGLEQLVDPSQVRTLGALLPWISEHGDAPVRDLAAQAVDASSRMGLYALEGAPELAAVRPLDLAAAIHRLRSLRPA